MVEVVGQGFHRGGKLGAGDGERRGEADDVAVRAFGQENETVAQQVFDDALHREGRRHAVGQTDFHAGHQTEAADGDFKLWIGDGAAQFAQEEFAKRRAVFDEFVAADLFDLRKSHGATDGMAEKGAGVYGFAVGHGPRDVHEVRAADARGEREAAGKGLAKADEIGRRAGVLAGKPFSGAPKPGVNLVQNQERAMLIA